MPVGAGQVIDPKLSESSAKVRRTGLSCPPASAVSHGHHLVAQAKAMEAQTPEEWKRIFLERQKIKGSGWAIVEEIDDPRRKI